MDRFKLLVKMLVGGEEVILTTRENTYRVKLELVETGVMAFTAPTSLHIDSQIVLEDEA